MYCRTAVVAVLNKLVMLGLGRNYGVEPLISAALDHAVVTLCPRYVVQHLPLGAVCQRVLNPLRVLVSCSIPHDRRQHPNTNDIRKTVGLLLSIVLQ